MDNRIMGKPIKPAKWGKKMDYTLDMASYADKLMFYENSINKGYNEKLDSVGDSGPLPLGSNDPSQGTVRVEDDKFYEYLSLEGGSNTIGYGHKIKEGEDFSKGLTKAEARSLMEEDLYEAYRHAYQRYSNRYGSEKGLTQKEGDAEWNKLSDKAKVVLTEISYNMGKASPGLMDAYFSRKKEKVKERIRGRSFVGKKGVIGRDESIILDYIKGDPYFSEEEAYMDRWNKEDNIFT